MLSGITFEKKLEEAKLLSPKKGFESEFQSIELREDPLTGRRSRLNETRLNREKQSERKEGNLTNIIEESRKQCPFCPENIEEKTPKFPEEFSEDRFEVGSACVFPNFYPFGRFHAVGVLTREHFLKPEEFSPDQIEDGLKASLKFIREVFEGYPEEKYATLSWNYLSPAGASILHPHFQILMGNSPPPQVENLVERSREYHDREGSNYWIDLMEMEREKGERFIGESESVFWLASFSPQGNNEILSIFDGVSSLARLDEFHIRGFSEGLSKVLDLYEDRGVVSFNMTTFSGPEDEDLSEYYLLNAKIASRPNLVPYYTSDVGFMEEFHNETVISTSPEELAKTLGRNF